MGIPLFSNLTVAPKVDCISVHAKDERCIAKVRNYLMQICDIRLQSTCRMTGYGWPKCNDLWKIEIAYDGPAWPMATRKRELSQNLKRQEIRPWRSSLKYWSPSLLARLGNMGALWARQSLTYHFIKTFMGPHRDPDIKPARDLAHPYRKINMLAKSRKEKEVNWWMVRKEDLSSEWTQGWYTKMNTIIINK